MKLSEVMPQPNDVQPDLSGISRPKTTDPSAPPMATPSVSTDAGDEQSYARMYLDALDKAKKLSPEEVTPENMKNMSSIDLLATMRTYDYEHESTSHCAI